MKSVFHDHVLYLPPVRLKCDDRQKYESINLLVSSLAIVVKNTRKKKLQKQNKKKRNVALGKFGPEFPFIVYSRLRGYLIPQASELIHLTFHCYETRVKIKTSCLPFQFYVPVYWYLITALGRVQHTKTQSK